VQASDGLAGPEPLTRVMLHYVDLPGLPAALSTIGGIDLVCPVDEAEVMQAVGSCPVLVTRRWQPGYLHPGLRCVQAMSAGYEQFPVAALGEAGVVLCTASGLHTSVAEHAIGLLLALTRDIHGSVAAASQRRWNPHDAAEVSGMTIVILGLGAIGQAIARRLSTWEARLIGVTRTPDVGRACLTDVRPLDQLADACAEASALMVAVALAPDTSGLVSGRELDALGDGWVVNVSRGGVIDEEAMVARLAGGRLRGAGLDVFAREPLAANSPLWTLPNVICTPHMAGMSPHYARRLAGLVAHNLRAFQGRAPWRNRVC
jgi:D-2-hydroxyacid dehydrogenase (NADP+)